MTKISSKRQVTLPIESLRATGLKPGDEVSIKASESGRIVVQRAEPSIDRGVGVFDGLYGAGYLDRLRSGERQP